MSLGTLFRGKRKKCSAKDAIVLDTLSDRFEGQRTVYESPQAIAYDCEDRLRRTRVILWKLRNPVKPELAEKLIANILVPAINASPLTFPVTAFGVAQERILFYASVPVPTYSLLDRSVAEKRKSLLVARSTRFISHLHESNFFLGCLHEHSFMVTRDETLFLNGLFPALPGQYSGGDIPSRAFEFSAPEVRSGQAATKASDVFALGAYFYRFLGGHEFPTHLDEQQLYQHLRVQLPLICSAERRAKWFEPILSKMLQWRSDRRYQSAIEVFADIESACPDLGVFGAGALKSIDNAASSYIMSPFTQAAVAAVTLGILVSVAIEHAGSSSSTPSAGSSDSTQSADLSSLSQIRNPGVFAHSTTNTNANGAEEVVGGVFNYTVDNETSEKSKTTSNVTTSSSRGSSAQTNNATSENEAYRLKRLARKSKRRSESRISPFSSTPQFWADRRDSALVHILRFGSFEYDPSEPLCHSRHLGRRKRN